MKAESVEEAIKQAEAAKASGERDIGPFYGLPSKVKQLLVEQRGISELYGTIQLSFAVSVNKELISTWASGQVTPNLTCPEENQLVKFKFDT